MIREVKRDPWCKHRTAFDRKFPVCKVGVDFHQFMRAGTRGKFYGDQMPCLGGSPEAKARCAQFENWTPEEIAERERQTEESLNRIRKALTAIREATGGKRGIGGNIPCPTCQQPLRYSVARVNGHVHARCATADCVSFLQ